MPQRNGTGPLGTGPATGRRLGNCAPKTQENTVADQNLGTRPAALGRGQGLRSGVGARRGLGRGQNRGR
jgi:hypothetical protein